VETSYQEKKAKLEKQVPSYLFELLRKRFAYLRDQTKDKYDSACREIRKEVLITLRNDDNLEKYVRELKEKNKHLENQIARYNEMIEILHKAIKNEREERSQKAISCKKAIEETKNEYAKSLKRLEECELGILRLKGEKSENDEIFLTYKILDRDYEQLKHEFDALQHKLEEQKCIVQNKHLKAIFILYKSK